MLGNSLTQSAFIIVSEANVKYECKRVGMVEYIRYLYMSHLNERVSHMYERVLI